MLESFLSGAMRLRAKAFYPSIDRRTEVVSGAFA